MIIIVRKHTHDYDLSFDVDFETVVYHVMVVVAVEDDVVSVMDYCYYH